MWSRTFSTSCTIGATQHPGFYKNYYRIYYVQIHINKNMHSLVLFVYVRISRIRNKNLDNSGKIHTFNIYKRTVTRTMNFYSRTIKCSQNYHELTSTLIKQWTFSSSTTNFHAHLATALSNLLLIMLLINSPSTNTFLGI